MKRRSLLKLNLAFLPAGLFAPAVRAQNWPSQPIRLVSPSPPGGAADVATRLIAKHLAEALGQPVLVDNRPGGNGVVAGLGALRGGKDGYSIFMGSTTTLVANPYLMKQVPFEPAVDFVPISLVASLPFVLVVNPSLPINSVKELIAYARERPGKVTFASANATSFVAASAFNHSVGVDMLHVPYKGAPASLTDIMGGQVDLSFVDYSSARTLIQSKRLRLLAVTSAKRSPLMPQTPTLAELGLPGYEVVGWTAMCAPAGVDPAIVQRLNKEMQKILSRKDVVEQLAVLGQDVLLGTPEEFASFMRTERPRWGRMIRNAGISPE